jgi:hypothetical protein
VSERVLRTLQYMFNAEPAVLVDMIGYGVIPALYSTFLRFRQHDNVLASVYGMVGYVYNVEAVLTASRIIEAVAKKEDTSVQAAFLQALALGDVEKIGALHRQIVGELRRKGPGQYLRITEGYSKNSTTAQKVTALNESLRSQLMHIRKLCEEHPSASTAAISQHIQLSIMPKWRSDLTPLITANMVGDTLDPMQASDDVIALECENMEGSDIEVTLLPKTVNWPAQPVFLHTKTTVSFEELHAFIFRHYHVSPVKVFMPSRQAGTPPSEILSDTALQSEPLTLTTPHLAPRDTHVHRPSRVGSTADVCCPLVRTHPHAHSLPDVLCHGAQGGAGAAADALRLLDRGLGLPWAGPCVLL